MRLKKLSAEDFFSMLLGARLVLKVLVLACLLSDANHKTGRPYKNVTAMSPRFKALAPNPKPQTLNPEPNLLNPKP